jgi:hypothetical protein
MEMIAELPLETLSVDARLLLLERVWDSLLDLGPPPLTSWHAGVIQSRIASADANPDAFISLETLRRDLLERKR